MRRLREAATTGPVVLLVFGALMAVHVGVTFAFSRVGTITVLLVAGVAASALALGAGLVLVRLVGPGDTGDTVVEPDLSLATAVLAAGIAAVALGAFVGPWLILVGAGLAVAGAGGLIRERRARPR